jgi:hypothetical protein
VWLGGGWLPGRTQLLCQARALARSSLKAVPAPCVARAGDHSEREEYYKRREAAEEAEEIERKRSYYKAHRGLARAWLCVWCVCVGGGCRPGLRTRVRLARAQA